MEPDKEYAFLALPSGVHGQGMTDQKGLLSLMLDHTSHELFFIVPAEQSAGLEVIAQRKTIFDLAMTLNGLVSPPTP